MTEGIIVAIITGVLALIGTIITVKNSANKTDTKLEKNYSEFEHKLEMSQAVTNTKLDELTREVREHNNFAKRVPVLEEQMKVTNNRLKDLEENTFKK